MRRLAPLLCLLPSLALAQTTAPEARPETPAVTDEGAGFAGWVAEIRGRASRAGISAATLDAAFRDIGYNAEVVRLDRNQAEFVKPIWTYLDTAVSEARVTNGRAALAREAETLAAVEERYEVEQEIVTAIWGLESAYGTYRGTTPTIEAMATLAFEGRRAAFFEDQLMTALRILDRGDVAAADMLGSWAGAMGHTQFIPTSYMSYAQDFDGDGKRNIWAEDPGDALASTAAYLAEHGWTYGQPWGVEVTLPEGWDYARADRRITALPSAWAAEGIAAADGSTVQDHAPASILLPAGAEGAAFLIFPNFEVIEAYNTADAYVIAVGHLGDRIGGGAALSAGWPREDRPLGPEDRLELQRLLTAAGFSTLGIDGRIGPNTINAIRDYQQTNGLIPDGYASSRLLDRLRGG